MKKFFCGIVGIALCLAFTGTAFAAGAKESKTTGSSVPQVNIGIAKILQHPALDACEQGIQDALKARGINAVYDLQNANGDPSTAAQIANKFKNSKVNVAVGIATPVAQALANAIKDIPIVFSAVTDPVGAGLVANVARGDGNVTGASDAIATSGNIAMFKEIAGVKTIGFIYCNSEANSVTELANIEGAVKELGLQLVTQTVNTTADVRQAAQSIVNRVDGIYMSTDNTVFTALPAIVEVFRAAKKPIFAGDATGAMDGGCLVAAGSNYYRLGLSTGNIVADIIQGKKPADIPVKFATEPSELDFLIDLDTAKNCGITIPKKYLDAATMIFENGTLVTR